MFDGSTQYQVIEASDLYLNQGALYFSARDLANGCELWKASRQEGVAYQFSLVRNINENGDLNPRHFASIGDITLFSANDGIVDQEHWRTDGTSEGTFLVRDIGVKDGGRDERCDLSMGDGNPDELVSTQGIVYFRACGDGGGHEIWR